MNPFEAVPLNIETNAQHKPSISLTQIPLCFGPIWHARANPECVMRAFLRQRGGSATTRDVCQLYVAHPWLKEAVGKLSHFCAGSEELLYDPRERGSSHHSPERQRGQRYVRSLWP